MLSKEEEGEETKYTGVPESQHTFEGDEPETETSMKINSTRNSYKRTVTEDSSKKIVKVFDNVEDYNEIELKIKECEERLEDGNRRCTLCDKVVPGHNRTNFRNHVERYHMEGLSFDCPHCDKTFRSRGTLSMHKRIHKTNSF